jgi:hypothetical protein
VSICKPYIAKPQIFEGLAMAFEGWVVTFKSLNILPEFERISPQMLRLADTLQSKGHPAVNYERLAFQEYNLNQSKYSLHQTISSSTQPIAKTATVTANSSW